MELTNEELNLLSNIIIARMALLRLMFGCSSFAENDSIVRFELEKLQNINNKICEAMK